MEKDQLDGLLAFRLVADKRNFTAAAETLGISPSAVSKMIRHLESRLGVTLLTRTTRATSLTEAGEAFLRRVAPALDSIHAAMSNAGSLGDKPAGRLRLNLPPMIYPNFLKSRVASFIEKYPDITLELVFENAATNIFEKGFDAGIRVSDILAQDMVAIKLLGPVRYVVAAAPSYLGRHGRPEHPQDLLSHNCIRVGAGTRIYEHWEFETNGAAFEVHVGGQFILNDSMLALDAALDGIGLIYINEDAITDKLDESSLEVVLSPYAPTSVGFYLYYPERSQVHPKLRAFIDHLKGSIGVPS
jgi:DNA-binding transcriptional LysR family regulator